MRPALSVEATVANAVEEAVERGAIAWFDRQQAERRDADRKDPRTGKLWAWDALTESDRRAYRAIVRPIVEAALNG